MRTKPRLCDLYGLQIWCPKESGGYTAPFVGDEIKRTMSIFLWPGAQGLSHGR